MECARRRATRRAWRAIPGGRRMRTTRRPGPATGCARWVGTVLGMSVCWAVMPALLGCTRLGTCGGTETYTCMACENRDETEYYVGQGTVNGTNSCPTADCETTCPPGETLVGECLRVSGPMCGPCSGTLPPNSEYVLECVSECLEDYYLSTGMESVAMCARSAGRRAQRGRFWMMHAHLRLTTSASRAICLCLRGRSDEGVRV